MPLPEDAEINHREADGGEDERKQHAVLEHRVGQMADIGGGADAAEHHEHPARQRGADHDQQ